MGFGEDILVAVFCMFMVFTLLASIYGLMKLTSLVITKYFSKKANG